MTAPDISGQQFGRLIAVAMDRRDEERHQWWSCVCACGEIWTVRRSDLVSGRTKSCGCLRQETSSRAMLGMLSRRRRSRIA